MWLKKKEETMKNTSCKHVGRVRQIALMLILLMCVSYGFAEKLAVLSEPQKPGMIDANEHELFVVDGVTVYVYSLKDYRLVRQFGKRGEGPGELIPDREMPPQLQLVNDKICLNSFNKMIYYSHQGKMLNERRVDFYAPQMRPVGNNYAIVKVSNDGDGMQTFKVILLDAGLKELKTLYQRSRRHPMSFGKMDIPPSFVFIRSFEDKVFVMDQAKGFTILVFNKNGDLLKTIEKDYKPIKMSEAYKKEIMEWLGRHPLFKEAPPELKNMIHLTEDLPVIRNFLVKDHKIYVRTYLQKNGLGEFFIFDENGKELKHIFLPEGDIEKIQGNPNSTYAFKGDKYYYVVDNSDSEVWELHVEKL
jgi:hypothetical protein